jgi:glycine cleavage system H protein
MQPSDLKYATTHEWVRVDGDLATIGISDYAQAELGDVVYVDLPSVGSKTANGDVFGSIESVKTVSDLIAPVTGEVVKVNGGLTETPEAINEDPYGSGWLVVVQMADLGQLDALMSAEQYETLIQEP